MPGSENQPAQLGTRTIFLVPSGNQAACELRARLTVEKEPSHILHNDLTRTFNELVTRADSRICHGT